MKKEPGGRRASAGSPVCPGTREGPERRAAGRGGGGAGALCRAEASRLGEEERRAGKPRTDRRERVPRPGGGEESRRPDAEAARPESSGSAPERRPLKADAARAPPRLTWSSGPGPQR